MREHLQRLLTISVRYSKGTWSSCCVLGPGLGALSSQGSERVCSCLCVLQQASPLPCRTWGWPHPSSHLLCLCEKYHKHKTIHSPCPAHLAGVRGPLWGSWRQTSLPHAPSHLSIQAWPRQLSLSGNNSRELGVNLFLSFSFLPFHSLPQQQKKKWPSFSVSPCYGLNCAPLPRAHVLTL